MSGYCRGTVEELLRIAIVVVASCKSNWFGPVGPVLDCLRMSRQDAGLCGKIVYAGCGTPEPGGELLP
jgi:hypothetical protein